MGKRASIILLATLTLIVGLATITQAADENHAAVVVSLGNGEVVSRCVSFSEPDISGFELLQRSGLQVVVDDQAAGAAICSINGTGCPADDCFCECRGGGTCTYWSYWHRQNDTWNYSPTGSSIYRISDGMIDGWSWGPGSVIEANAPPALSFSDVCALDTEPTPTLTPSATAAAIVIPSVVAAVETPHVGSPTSTVQPAATSPTASTPIPAALSPTVRPPDGAATSVASTLPPQPVSTEPSDSQLSGQLRISAETSTPEFETVAQGQTDQPQPEQSATQEAYPDPMAVEGIVVEEQRVSVVVERPIENVAAIVEPQVLPTALAVIGSRAVPEAGSAEGVEATLTESQSEAAINWRQYVVFAAMLLALVVLIGVVRLHSDGLQGHR